MLCTPSTLVAGHKTLVSLDLDEVDTPSGTSLELQLLYEVYDEAARVWAPAHHQPPQVVWGEAGPCPNALEVTVWVPLHPFPVDTPVLRSRWALALLASGDHQATPAPIAHMPVDVVRLGARTKMESRFSEGDAVGPAHAPLLADAVPGAGKGVVGQRTLSWGHEGVFLDGEALADHVQAIHVGRALMGTQAAFVLELILVRRHDWPQKIKLLDLMEAPALGRLPYTDADGESVGWFDGLPGLYARLVEAGTHVSTWTYSSTRKPLGATQAAQCEEHQDMAWNPQVVASLVSGWGPEESLSRTQDALHEPRRLKPRFTHRFLMKGRAEWATACLALLAVIWAFVVTLADLEVAFDNLENILYTALLLLVSVGLAYLATSTVMMRAEVSSGFTAHGAISDVDFHFFDAPIPPLQFLLLWRAGVGNVNHEEIVTGTTGGESLRVTQLDGPEDYVHTLTGQAVKVRTRLVVSLQSPHEGPSSVHVRIRGDRTFVEWCVRCVRNGKTIAEIPLWFLPSQHEEAHAG